jgi:hypothetical protein
MPGLKTKDMPVRKSLLPFFLIFILVNALAIVFRSLLEQKGFSQEVLLIGNLILFSVTILSFVMMQKGIGAASAHAFVRSVYSAFLSKIILFAAAVLIYVLVVKKGVNKPSLFTCLFLYLVYTFIEVRILFKLAKQKKNA